MSYYMILLIRIFVLFLDSVCHGSLFVAILSVDQKVDILIRSDCFSNFLVFACKKLSSSPSVLFSQCS